MYWSVLCAAFMRNKWIIIIIKQLCWWSGITSWASRWQMKFNVSKCKDIHYGKGNLGYNYSMEGVPVEEAYCEKDLSCLHQVVYKSSTTSSSNTSLFPAATLHRRWFFSDRPGILSTYISDPPKSLGPLLSAYNTTLSSLLHKHAPIVDKLSRRHSPSNPCSDLVVKFELGVGNL